MPVPQGPTAARPAAVEIENLEFGWTRDASLLSIGEWRIAAGECVLLSGPSGCGKSTLLGLITGVLQPRTGEVRIAGTALRALAPGARDRFRGAHIGYIFQMFNLIPYLDVLENVLLPLRLSSGRRARLGRTRPEEEAQRLLDALGIAPEARSRRVIGQLSIGQQQRVAAARALIGRPGLIIADEPTSSLDATAREEFLQLLLTECAAGGSALLLVSHDVAPGRRFDRVLTLADINRASRAPRQALACPS